MTAPAGTIAQLARNLRRRRRGEAPPDSPRQVMLLLRPDVLAEARPTRAAIRRAGAVAGDGGVVVVQVLRLHGYAWGLPNPGLMPTLEERSAAHARVAAVISALEREGIDADGQILVTRHDAKGVARIATRRGVSTIVIEQKAYGAVRTFIEGDLSRVLGRRLPGTVGIEVVSAAGSAQ